MVVKYDMKSDSDEYNTNVSEVLVKNDNDEHDTNKEKYHYDEW